MLVQTPGPKLSRNMRIYQENKVCKTGLEALPNTTMIIGGQASCALSLGEKEKAENYYRQALKLDPDVYQHLQETKKAMATLSTDEN